MPLDRKIRNFVRGPIAADSRTRQRPFVFYVEIDGLCERVGTHRLVTSRPSIWGEGQSESTLGEIKFLALIIDNCILLAFFSFL